MCVCGMCILVHVYVHACLHMCDTLHALFKCCVSHHLSWVHVPLQPKETGVGCSLVVDLVQLTLGALEVYVKNEISSSVLQRASLLTFLLISLLRHAIEWVECTPTHP